MEPFGALRRAELLVPGDLASFLRRGHFVYESGDHGDTWLALDLLFADPRRLRRAAARLADLLRPHTPELVCGPMIGGALVAQWVAHELETSFVYATSQAGYAIPHDLAPLLAGKRVAVVDDAINAGWATMACIREIEHHRGSVVAVAALLVRSPGPSGLPCPIVAPMELPWEVWPAHECPLCRAGVPIDHTVSSTL